jgi:hypothetical protein
MLLGFCKPIGRRLYFVRSIIYGTTDAIIPILSYELLCLLYSLSTKYKCMDERCYPILLLFCFVQSVNHWCQHVCARDTSMDFVYVCVCVRYMSMDTVTCKHPQQHIKLNCNHGNNRWPIIPNLKPYHFGDTFLSIVVPKFQFYLTMTSNLAPSSSSYGTTHTQHIHVVIAVFK